MLLPVFQYLPFHGRTGAALVSPALNHLAASNEMLPALRTEAALCCRDADGTPGTLQEPKQMPLYNQGTDFKVI